jgi:uncharacterized Zn finger protein (UPF0148 family)
MSPQGELECTKCNVTYAQEGAPKAEPFRSRNDTSKLMGEKMLQGWAMLAQSCEDCLVPLMRDKAAN